LDERLGQLYAASDPTAGPELQLMTIHKAKGLEFDTVILPGLGRCVRAPDRSLLLWQERLDPARKREGLMLAPIPACAADEQDPTYRAIARIHAEKDRLETLRLFYVAATRAKQRLHLLGHVERNKAGELVPATGSFLNAAWPALGAAAAAAAIEAPVGSPTPKTPGILLRRLPLGWTAPLPAPAVAITGTAIARRASDAGHHDGLLRSLSLRTDEGRIIGTVVHEWLERIARDGVANWPEERLRATRANLGPVLISSGVPRGRVEACVDRAMTALANTLRSQHGRWILEAHRDAACELALSGVVDGVTVHAVIDRTFVDAHGVRWVIDYKTSTPAGEEAVELFLAEEVARYRTQLDTYRRLLALRSPEQQVRAALYFPLLDAWREVE
jgi:ATP-dependent exoDNAse (exonuclease V) beta subunit